MIALVLAGGENKRYPTPKGLIEVRGEKIIERHIRIFRAMGLTPYISSNSPGLYDFTGVPLISDSVKSAGPMSGIVSAFDATGTGELMVTACDMPFINSEMIEYIISHRGGEATVPAPSGVPEPLMAVYTKSASEKMRKCISEGRASMRDMLRLLDTRLIGDEDIRNIDPEGLSFVNINTPDDYNRALGNPGGL